MRMSDKTLVYAALLSICLSFGCKSKSGANGQGQTPAEVLPWIHDDYSRAIQASEAKGLPLVLDFWAAWCHTCLSMKHTVLRDPKLKEFADDAIWVAIDTENPVNQDMLEMHSISVWPTFLVADSKGNIAARQLGSTSVDSFISFLKRGFKDIKSNDSKSRLAQADSEAAKGNYHEASEHYQHAMSGTPGGTTPAPESVLAWIESLHRLGRFDECAQAGQAKLDDIAKSNNATLADFAYFLTDCQKRISSKEAEPTRNRFIALIENLLKNRSSELSVDDRSEALKMLRSFYDQSNKTDEAQKTAQRQKLLLDKAVKDSKTPFEAMTYSYPRLDVYSYLGVIEELIPWFKDLSQTLKNEYDPPYRLASVYSHLEQFDKALKSADIAKARAHGPRKARICSFMANLHSKSKHFDEAIKSQHQAIEILSKQPQTSRTAKTLKTYRTELSRLQQLQTANGN